MIKFSKTTLSNGLRVITAPINHTRAVSVMVAIGAGSRYENARQNGLSHFLEHMVFKGTDKRPTTLDISRELDAVGASYNAFTAEEETGFYVRAESSHFNLAVDTLADILFHSRFDPKEIAKEKGVILEEINMYQDIPQRYVQDLAKNLFYGDTPLGRPVAGSKKTVLGLERKDFLQYRQELYRPNNMVVVVAGAGREKDWLSIIKEKFGQLPKKEEKKWQKIQESQTSPRSLIHYKKTDQTHLFIGVRTFARHDPRRPVLKIINNILGDTMSSRLFSEIREKRGLAYYVSTEMAEFHDTGIFAASLGVDIKRTNEAIKVVLEEFIRIKKKGVSKKELSQAKENMQGRLYLGLEDSLSVAEFLAGQELLWQEIKTPEEIIKEIYKVSLDDIISVSQEIFQPEGLNLALIGPHKDQQKFNHLLEI